MFVLVLLFCTPILFLIPPFFSSKGYKTPKLKIHWKHCLFQQAENLIPPGFYLLGDSAFPLTRWLITPFRNFGNLTQQQHRFNTTHAKARVAIERTFGILKCRFHRFLRFYASEMNIIVDTILSACIVHNICVKDGDDMFDDMVDDNCFDNNERVPRQGKEFSGIRLRQEPVQQLQTN